MTRPKRIVFVMSKYAVGGLEKQLAALIEFRPERARGYEVHTITLGAARSPDVQRRFEAAGAHNTLVDRASLPFPLFFLRLVRTMVRLRPVLVSTLLDSSVGAWGRLAAWLARVPVIVHSDRLLATEGTRVHYLLRPFLDRVTDRFLPNAEAIAERLVADGISRDKIRVMHNGVDLATFDPASVPDLRSAWGVPESACVLGYLGRFAPQKRVDLLLDALSSLPIDQRPDYVVMAGTGSTFDEIEERIGADPWLAARCRLLGATDDAPGFLKSIDYLVLASDSEGFPNVVLEAMAMGKPVVATSVSDVPYLVGDAGRVVPPGDAAALAAAVGELQRMGPEERRRLGARARARIEAEFDIVVRSERFWDAHLDLLPADPQVRPSW